jgi:phosphonate transport system substrate-binding protein
MGNHTDSFCCAVTGYLEAELSIPTEYVNNISWQEREHLFDLELIQICWICGWPYAIKADRPDPKVELLVVPVPSGNRYACRPIYFSDVVVRSTSPYRTFSDLRGSRWAYNERRSHSGYNLVRYYLSCAGVGAEYFGRMIESGAHRASLQMILDDCVDGSAIDSTVLDWEMRHRPEIRSEIRIIETLGPSPAPPWVVSSSLSADVRTALQDILLSMHKTERGRAVLTVGHIDRFVTAQDEDYDVIRAMACAGGIGSPVGTDLLSIERSPSQKSNDSILTMSFSLTVNLFSHFSSAAYHAPAKPGTPTRRGEFPL